MGISGGSLGGGISAVNSSTTPLLSGQIFTGDWEEVSFFAYFSLSIYSDQSSATDGVEFQWSSNAIDIDRNEPTNLTGGTGRAFAFTPRARFFRVKYTNGAINQTAFRLQTVYHVSGIGHVTKSLKQNVNEDNFAYLVQAPVMAKLADNSYTNIAGLQLNSTSLLGVVDHDAMFAHLGHTFFCTSNSVAGGGATEQGFILIRNPVGSGKTIRFDKVTLCVPNAGSILYRLYQSPTITTTGSALTIVGARQTGQSSPVSLIYLNPTYSATGTPFYVMRTEAGGTSMMFESDFSKILEPGFDMLITVTKAASGNEASVNLEFCEL